MSRTPLRPLSIGNIVSTGLVLYRSNLKAYFFIALQAYLWILLPLILFGVASGFLVINRQYPILLLVIAFLTLLGGIGKYLTNSALISRLAYQELTGKPETESAARKQIDPKIWKFWGVSIIVSVQLFLIYLLTAIAFGIVGGVIGFVLGGILGRLLTGFLITAIVVIAVVVVVSWYFARWGIAELPLAIENNLTGGESIKRSWSLTENSALRVQGVFLIAFLVTIPITAITTYVPQFIFAAATPGSTIFWIGTAISFVFSLLGSILVLPLWQTIKSATYYDLRTRREGLDIGLRSSNNDNNDNDFL